MPKFGQGYATVEDAAEAALMMLSRLPRVAQQEYMAILVQDPRDEQFYRTEFQTLGERTRSAWRGVLPGQEAGMVHNHPVMRAGDYPNTLFSEVDLRSSKQTGVPSFLAAIQRAGDAAHLQMNPDRTQVIGAGSQRQLAAEGEPFLAQFPIEEFKQLLARKLLGRQPTDPRGLRR